jgi:hypothetical protein
MEVNQKLSNEYKGKRYRRPTDQREIVISHVLQTDVPDHTPYLEAFYNVLQPEIGSSGHGKCPLESLRSLVQLN